MISIYFGGCQYWIHIIFFLGFPALDVISDIGYILESRFYNWYIFGLCVFFVSFPIFRFPYYVFIKKEKYPAITPIPYWSHPPSICTIIVLSYSSKRREDNDPNADPYFYPTIRRDRFYVIYPCEDHSSLALHLWNWVIVWLFAVLYQLLVIIYIVTWILIHPFVMLIWFILILPVRIFLWFIFGIILQYYKFMTIGQISGYWFLVWNGVDESDDDGFLDTEELNKDILIEIFAESFPQIIVQCLNNAYLNSWSVWGIVSISCSSLMILNNFYRYFYYLCQRNVAWKDIPFEFPIDIPFLRFLKLKPHSRSEKGKSKAYDEDENYDLSYSDSKFTVDDSRSKYDTNPLTLEEPLLK